jgi:hypothetical protein
LRARRRLLAHSDLPSRPDHTVFELFHRFTWLEAKEKLELAAVQKDRFSGAGAAKKAAITRPTEKIFGTKAVVVLLYI